MAYHGRSELLDFVDVSKPLMLSLRWEFTHSDGTKEEDRSRTTNFVPSRVRDSMDQYHGWQLPYDENFDGLTFYVRKHE